ncbi:MAG: hypothetical protein QXY85_07915 [Candidatus Nitrosocaldus sp.]
MDRWMVFIVSQFVSAVLGFLWGIVTSNLLFVYIGGFFFAVGVFAITRWGYYKLKHVRDRDEDRYGERRRKGRDG